MPQSITYLWSNMITSEDTDGVGTVEKLVDWKKIPELRELKQDLEDARPIHATQVSKINSWLDNYHGTGDAKAKAPKGSSQIVPRLIRKQAEWRYPALSEPFLSSPDIFNVNPVSWEDKKAAIQNEMVLNHQFNTQINKVKFIDEYVRTPVDEGTVIVRVGWETIEEKYTDEVPQYEYVQDSSFAPQLQQAAQSDPSQLPEEMVNAMQFTQQYGTPYRPNLTGYKPVEKTRLLVNRPTLQVMDYRNVVIDPLCQGDIKKARFICISFESSLSELKQDGRYKNLDKIMLTGNEPLSDTDHAASDGGANFNFSDKPRTKFVVYEYWGYRDIDGDGIVKPIVASWVGNTMIRMEENPFPDKELPFVTVPYLPVRKSIYGEPDGALLEDNQKIIGAVTRGIIDIMGKSANGQTGMAKNMLDTTNKRRYDAGLDYEFNPTVDPRLGIHMHTYPEIPQSAQFMIQLHQMEAQSMTGVKDYAGSGISGAALGDVAAGVRGALDAASKRELGILRRLAQGMIEIGRKIISMNGVFLSEEEVIRITNEQFVTIRRDDLAGNFDLRLSISTAEEDNSKAQELSFMLQTMGPNEDPGMRKIILADICRLKKMPDLAKRIEEFEPQPDPMQQQMQQLEMARLQYEVAKIEAETARIRAEAGLTTQKIETESAKAENLRADTDAMNLDFVEQESGVTQTRELQKQGEQARANMALEVVKGHVKSKFEKKTTTKK
jgi:hypothetical protein